MAEKEGAVATSNGNESKQAVMITLPQKPRIKKQKNSKKKTAASGRLRGPKSYPVQTFEEVLKIGQGIMDKASGQPVKRMTLLKELQLADNLATRTLISSSARYQITRGNQRSESLSLEPKGRIAVDPASSAKERQRARFELAIQNIPAFNKLYEQYKGNKMPSLQVMQDHLEEVDSGDRSQCVDIFVQNIKFVGLLRMSEGAEFIVPIEEAAGIELSPMAQTLSGSATAVNQPTVAEDFDNVCFFIAPIGDAGSEHRKHSDAILASYVERALQTVDPKMKVVRADKIEQPGMISKQVVEYILKSKLVVADLSYQNPNVFYELCFRHVTGKPVIHIRRSNDKIPFDVNNFKTIEIRFEDKFDVLAELETIRSAIAQYARQAMATGISVDNPILTYCPDYRFAKVDARPQK
jgi:hypothetical protein